MTELLSWVAIIVLAAGISLYYLLVIRRDEDTDWYGGPWEPANLYILPLCTPVFAVSGLYGLLAELGVSEDSLLPVMAAPITLTVLLAALGILGGIGVPLPWPLTPRWVVQRKRRDRAEKKARRTERGTPNPAPGRR